MGLPALSTEGSPEENPSRILSEVTESPEQVHWSKIRFDNSLRLWIASLAYSVCAILWLGGVLDSIVPMTIVTVFFGAVQFGVMWASMGMGTPQRADYLLCGVDLVAMSFGVYFTGGTASPLYFIYFIPLIVHAFHHDWGLILFNGFGGVLMYAAAIAVSLSTAPDAGFLDLGARVFFMLLTVCIAAFAVNALRERDAADKTRLVRLRLLAGVGESLNGVNALNDLPRAVSLLVERINRDIAPAFEGWSRVLLTIEDPSILRAVSAPNDSRPDLAQEISSVTCPAFHGNRPFELKDANQDASCPVERFSFGSHLCIPISASGNETFGVVFMGSRRPNAFGREEAELMEFIGRSIGLAVQRLQRVEDLRRSLELDSCATAAFLSSSRSLSTTYTTIVEGLQMILSANQASVMMWDPAKSVLHTVEARGPFAGLEWNLRFHMGEGLPGKAVERGEAYSTGDLALEPTYQKARIPARALLSLPMRTMKGEPIGVLNVLRIEDAKPFTRDEIERGMTFAARSALALENALLHQKRSEARARPDASPTEQRAA